MPIMTEPFPGARRDYLTATRFRVAVLLSLVLHALALWELPAMPRLRPGPLEEEARNVPLSVRLAPPPAPTAQAAPAPRERPRALARPAPPVERAQPAPRPAAPPAMDAPAVATAPARAPVETDLMAYVEARRRARAEAAGGSESRPREQDENERASRTATANLAGTREQVFGYDPAKSGGVFQVEHLGFDYAEFTFVGWNGDARRYTKQLIEVRKGANSDIRIAVVRRIIAIIREHEPEEFTWDSKRLGRSLTLSSRSRDSAGLEDFMMAEFFAGSAAARR